MVENHSYDVEFYIDRTNLLRYKLWKTDRPDLSVGEEYQWDRQQNEKYLYAPNSKLQKVLELAVKELLDISDIRVKAGEIRTNLANTPNNQRTIESIQVEKHSYNVQFYIDKDKFLRYKLWKTTDPNLSVARNTNGPYSRMRTTCTHQTRLEASARISSQKAPRHLIKLKHIAYNDIKTQISKDAHDLTTRCGTAIASLQAMISVPVVQDFLC